VRFASVFALYISLSFAQGPSPTVTAILPQELKWRPSGVDRIDTAALVGDPSSKSPSIWVGRGRFARGSSLLRHWHPDTRYVTVLSGTYYQGASERFDPAAARAYPAGSFIVVPAGVKHFVWAKDGDVVIQESGTSPTGVSFVDQSAQGH
jgi:Cupin